MADFSVGDLGAAILVQVQERGQPIDLSGAASAQFLVTPPGATAPLTWTATILPAGTYTYGTLTITTTGHEGWLLYLTSAVGQGDLTTPGEWKGRVKLAGLGAWTGRSLGSFAFLVAP